MFEGIVKLIFNCTGTWDLTALHVDSLNPWPTSVLYPRNGPLVSAVGCIQGGVRTKSEHVTVSAGSPSRVNTG